MKIPQLPVKKEIPISFFPNGGLNTSVTPDEIADNQCSDMLNMWYRNKMLRIRPGLVKKIEQAYGKIVDVCPKNGTKTLIRQVSVNGEVTEETYGVYILTATSLLSYDGQSIDRLTKNTSSKYNVTTGKWDFAYDTFNFFSAKMILSDKISETFDEISKVNVKSNSVYVIGDGFFGFTVLSGYFDFTNSQQYIGARLLNIYDIYQYENAYPFYIPTIYINLKPSGRGDKLESRNMLTPMVKTRHFTTGSDKVYHLPDQNIDNTDVTVTYNNLSGNTITFGFQKDETTDIQSSITATLDRTAGTITFSVALVDAATAEAATENLVVEYSKTVYSDPPILHCNIVSWFGGTLEGQESGTSIFLAGNPSEPNKVCWSASDNPNYWPDDNVNSIGSPSDPITAFGKQFGVLVVLKQNSVYRIAYEWDSTNKKSLFPVQEVHVGIGCDMPGSVQLIDSSIVWANSKGGIFTLMSTSIKDERVVRPVSKNINTLLLAENSADLQVCSSLDTGTHYMLFVGKNVYVWDYENTPYTYSTTYINANDKIENSLAWYKWAIPQKIATAFLFDNQIYGASTDDNFLYAFDETQGTDGGAWFEAHITSKLFDFSLPTMTKLVHQLFITFANSYSVSAWVTLGDDYGDSDEIQTLDNSDVETAKTYSYHPCTSWTQFFKLTVKRTDGDNGLFGIGKLTLTAKIGRNVQ